MSENLSRSLSKNFSQKLLSLKNQREFDAVNKTGKKFVGKFVIAVISQKFSNDTDAFSTQRTYLGLKVGRKFGNAVTRNKFKRRIRAIIYNISKTYSGNIFIIIPKLHASKTDYKNLEQDLNKICLNIL